MSSMFIAASSARSANRSIMRCSSVSSPSWLRALLFARVSSSPICMGGRRRRQAEIQRGAFLVVLGLVKKVALADNFAPIVDRYFTGVQSHPGGVTAWGAMFAFALQIFFDFSGYTDIAIGCALLLGFHFPINFRRPYLAVSITDFWRRWHISLSSWLRDYLYIPLGGNRKGRRRLIGIC